MEYDLAEEIVKEFFQLRLKMYSYITDNDYIYKKANDTKRCVRKHKPKFEDYKNCRENNGVNRNFIQEAEE